MLNKDGIRFWYKKRQKFGTIIWYSKNYVMKLEDCRHPDKLNNLEKETEIIELLNSRGSLSTPKIYSKGVLDDKRYIILERVRSRSGWSNVDVLLAFMELKGLGVIHGDLRFGGSIINRSSTNILFQNRKCVLIDYDQAIVDEAVMPMNMLEAIDYVDKKYPNLARTCGSLEDQLSRFHYKEYIKNKRLDVSETSILCAGVSTDYGSGIYHRINGKYVYSVGERAIEARIPLLDKIDFAGENVADIGSNTGEISRYILSLGARKVVGFEYCKEHAIAGQMINNIEGATGCRIQHHDIGKSVLPQTFDTALLLSVLHHVEDMQGAARHISLSCKRIIIECRLCENGYRYTKKSWEKTNGWSFNKLSELTSYLEKLFNFKYVKCFGLTDRDRYILEFRKS